MRNLKHSGWTANADGTHSAKIGRTAITIYPPRPWQFWRGDHKGIPCHTGPGERRTVSFHGSHSGGAQTLEGAKALALWVVQNDLTGLTPPDSIFAQEELDARALFTATVAYVDQTFGKD